MNFRFSIGAKRMNGTIWVRWLESFSDDRKSRIQNRKSVRIFAIVLIFVLAGAVAQAQPPKKIFRIGYLSAQDAAIESNRSDAIRLALRELGYIEGQNLGIEYRYVEGRKYDRAGELAAELVSLRVDIIVASGGARVIRPAKNATSTIPIVMVGQGVDPVKAGCVKSLARPGGNLTGITMLTRELSGKRLELLQEAVPKISRIAVLYEPGPVATLEVKDLQSAARELRLNIQTWEVRDADEFEKVFAAISKADPDGLYIAGSTLVFANLTRTARFALKSRLPSIYNGKDFVDEGGLLSYGADVVASYRRVAYYVDRILKGIKPAELPIEQPTKFELVINLKTAKQIGLTTPPNILARADRVLK
jgi:putative ABC transport system substrate-binding protein